MYDDSPKVFITPQRSFDFTQFAPTERDRAADLLAASRAVHLMADFPIIPAARALEIARDLPPMKEVIDLLPSEYKVGSAFVVHDSVTMDLRPNWHKLHTTVEDESRKRKQKRKAAEASRRKNRR